LLRVPASVRGAQEQAGRNFLLVRSGIGFALLASVLTVQFRSPDPELAERFKYLYIAVLLSYGWLLIRYAAWGRERFPDFGAHMQALIDAAFISILVFATGGFDSVFSFMYVLVILLGSLERYMRGRSCGPCFPRRANPSSSTCR
jgi:hypothetical protein